MMEDEEIINLFWNRNENAIQAVSEKYNALCYHMAWNVLYNNEDAEECVSDTWFEAWRKIPPEKPRILSAFLCKISRRRAIDCLRRQSAQKRMQKNQILMEEIETLNLAVTHGLEENMEREELVSKINQFLHGLPEKKRDIFLQRYWKMESIKSIAIRHHCSEGAIKQHLFHTRKKLEKKLKGEGLL